MSSQGVPIGPLRGVTGCGGGPIPNVKSNCFICFFKRMFGF